MSDIIQVKGVETNNLKKIDVEIKKKLINLIIGSSGSGKSSLAYDTLAQIGQYEFNSMFSDTPIEPNFKVESYSGMIATVPIKQTNTNTNIRSTIGTYFNINAHAAILFSALLDTSYDFFVLNKEENVCPHCHGLGVVKELDLVKLIDQNIPLEQCPVKCWVRYKGFYKDIIKLFCQDIGIDSTKKYKELSDEEKNKFLFHESDKKYSIRFKKTDRFSRRTTKYYGVMTEKPMMPNFAPSKSFYSDVVCPTCSGEKYSLEHRKLKFGGLSIGEFMCTPFVKLKEWIEKLPKEVKTSNLNFSLQQISEFVTTAVSLSLGYLHFNRTIPSLSGGELQRIRLVQVFNTQLTDLLVVLDEPLAGLSANEKVELYKSIKKIAEDHTLLLIDHHNLFYEDSTNIIALGERSGKYGGSLIDAKKYIASQKIKHNFQPKGESTLLNIKLQTPIYSYLGIDITLASNCLNLISGSSGIGKSTLLREYLPLYFDNYTYINQKPLHGNSNSYVATALNIYNPIIEHFAKKYKKDKKFFSNHTGSEGTCPICSGNGYLFLGTEYGEKISIQCKECDGTGFHPRLKKYTLSGKTIFEIWKLTIEEAYSFFQFIDIRLTKKMAYAKEIMLEHLVLGQPTATLSGGENIRVKILKSLKSTSKVYGIDEPYRGLSHVEIYKLSMFFNSYLNSNKTIIIADHEEESFQYVTRHLVLQNQKNILVGENYGGPK